MKRSPPERRFAWIDRSFLSDTAGLCILGLCLLLLYRVVMPKFGMVTYGIGDATGVSPLPVEVLSPPGTELRASFSLQVSRFSPRWYLLRADDCVVNLYIDGHDAAGILPPCTLPGEPERLNLSRFLRPGKHLVIVTVRSGGPELLGFDMRPSRMDPFIVAIWVLMISAALTLAHMISHAFRRRLPSRDPHVLRHHLPTFARLLRRLADPMAVAWIIGLVFFFTYVAIQPRIISGYYTDSGHQLHLFRGTFVAPKNTEDTYHLYFAVNYAWLRPPTLRVMGDDCVQGLVVNGLRVPGLQGEVCGYDVGARVQVSDYVHSGINTMQAVVHNVGGAGSLRIEVDPSDPLVTFLLFVAALAGSVGLWLTLRRYSIADDRVIAAIIFIGIAARAFYFFSTPFYVRANDVDGHIEYAHFILNHGRLPGMRDTWESFQPPLYYIVSAAMIGAAREFHIVGYDEITIVQSLSPILSIIAFLLCIGMLRRLVDPKKYRLEFALAVAALAVLPGSIYNAGRVNNDALVQFFMIVGLYEVIRCFDPGARKLRHWVFALVALALGIATKTNALILAPPLVLASPFIFRNLGRKRWLMPVLAALLITVCYLGVYAMRDPQKDHVVVTNIVTNSVALNGDLAIPNTPEAFLMFSPVQVLEHPFNDGWTNAQRRSYFLEYLYKSAFFGEWGFADTFLFAARWLVLAGMLCMPLGLLGVFTSVRRLQPAGIVLLLYGISVLLLHAIFRYQYPFSPSQDFRYVSSVSVAMAGFTALGIAGLPKRLRPYGVAIMLLFVIAAFSFMIRLP